MLSDDQILRIAVAFAAERFGDREFTYELVQNLALSDPPGLYFNVVPNQGYLIGAGGFFVSRVDGTVLELGSGDLVQAALKCGSPFYQATDLAELVPIAVRAALARSQPTVRVRVPPN